MAFAACHGLGCVPWGAACLGLSCVPWGAAALGLGCVPWPWQHALGGCCLGPWLLHALGGYMPWPWLRALALAACHGGQPLALAGSPWPWQHALALAACHGLRCVPWPWQHAMALPSLLPWPSLPCPQILSDFPKNEGFLEKEVTFPQRGRRWAWQGAQGHARMHATPHRPASSRTPAKLARAFSPFCVPKFSP